MQPAPPQSHYNFAPPGNYGTARYAPTPTGAYQYNRPAFPSYSGPSGLRGMAPIQQLNEQPQFRTGPVRRPPPHYAQSAYSAPSHPPAYGQAHVMYQPPPPPPPPGGFSAPYRAPAHVGHRMVVQEPRPAKRPRAEYFCESCTKGFDCEEDYDIHIAEDHVTCTHPGCGFSGREEVVRAHKVRHTVNADSPEEIDAWIAMRRHKFPRRAGALPHADEPVAVSKLEKFIRGSIRQSRIEARQRRQERDTKQACIHWERTGKCKFGDSCSFAHEKQGVCTFFVNHGRCRHGDNCKYKHVRANSRELAEMRNPHGGLLKKLLSVETTKYENTMLQILRHAVNNDFYQGGVRAAADAVEDAEGDFESDCSSFDDSDHEDLEFPQLVQAFQPAVVPAVTHQLPQQFQPAVVGNEPSPPHSPSSPISNCS